MESATAAIERILADHVKCLGTLAPAKTMYLEKRLSMAQGEIEKLKAQAVAERERFDQTIESMRVAFAEMKRNVELIEGKEK